ncbi:transcription termination/antitermination NusG family protein [Sphingomonas sp. UYP23]
MRSDDRFHLRGLWVILRTSGGRTLALVDSLREVGFDVWTPIEERSRLAARNRELVEQVVAILPGYVFARYDRLDDLLNLSRSPTLNYQVWDAEKRKMVTRGHPHFSVFQMHGRVRPQSDLSLVPLRALEAALQKVADRRRERAGQKGSPPIFAAGQIVRVGEGSFGGLELTVAETNNGKDVKLTHPDWTWPIEISAWKLADIQVEAQPSGPAASAA